MALASYKAIGPMTLVLACLISGRGLLAQSTQIDPERDAEIEQCLSTGEIKKKTEPLEGVTRPVRVEIGCDGGTRNAAFKTLDVYRRGLTRLGDGSWEVNFADTYRFERAAYLIDRELGLSMVPAAVIRTVRLQEGALVDWVPGASHERDLVPALTGSEIAALADEKALMHLFDALIFNTDRNAKNWLIGSDRQSLYLIDHSRSFRASKVVPESFLSKRVWLTRQVYTNLVGLRRGRLIELLDGLVQPGLVDALLSRRDQLLELIESACAEVGEDLVIRE